MYEIMNACMNEWTNSWINERMNENMSEKWMNAWTNVGAKKLVKECGNKWMKKVQVLAVQVLNISSGKAIKTNLIREHFNAEFIFL